MIRLRALPWLLLLSCCTVASIAASASSPDADPSSEIVPFQIRVPDETLIRLHAKLALSSLPDLHQPAGHEWTRGTSLQFMTRLIARWRTDSNSTQQAEERYNWRERERQLNLLPHFRTTVSGYTLHFIHARSPRADAIPLLFSHGWPGSFLECLQVLPGLTHPSDPSMPAFHVVCPSLPGYGFSPLPTDGRKTDVRKVAQLFVGLMARLQYSQYVAQGGDWGSLIVSEMAMQDPTHCRGIHFNMAPVGPPLFLFPIRNPVYALWRAINTLIDFAFPTLRFDAEEAAMVRAPLSWAWDQTAYFHEQATRPDTLGIALHDSPVGLASWLVEKFRQWSDCHGDVESVFSMDELLDHVMIYYVTDSIATSIQLYFETAHPSTPNADGEAPGSMLSSLMQWDVKVPSAFAAFPAELARMPRKWIQEHFNLKQYTLHTRGGHFAAMEVPDLWLDDVRRFVRDHVRIDEDTKQTQQKEEL